MTKIEESFEEERLVRQEKLASHLKLVNSSLNGEDLIESDIYRDENEETQILERKFDTAEGLKENLNTLVQVMADQIN